MNIGFIGLGNVGGKLAGSLMRNGKNVSVHDLNKNFVKSFIKSLVKNSLTKAIKPRSAYNTWALNSSRG